jgi:SAM-dependent methyltransferase
VTGTIGSNLLRLYPEIGAGGFTHVDGTVDFYGRVNALLEPHFVVLDLGAGRGAQLLEYPGSWRTRLCALKGKVARIVGADLDEAVLENPFLDEARLLAIGEPWPFADDSFDLIVADWVLEHVANPDEFAAEIRRVLKPGGWFCARTPNRWGIIGLGANLVPNRLHTKFLARLQPERKEIDVFPTVYRLNTRRQLRRYFDKAAWADFSYVSNAEPPYVQRSRIAMHLVSLYWRLTPKALHTVLNVFLRAGPK